MAGIMKTHVAVSVHVNTDTTIVENVIDHSSGRTIWVSLDGSVNLHFRDIESVVALRDVLGRLLSFLAVEPFSDINPVTGVSRDYKYTSS
jgi:hypothetical protein